jgi:alanine racemase
VNECYRCWAEVDLDALRENLAQIRSLAGPGRRVLAVVKADAYGHGLRETAAVLMQNGADVFGVANLAEARAIRSVGRGWPILMLGACLPLEAELAVREGVMATVSSLEEARRFSAAATRLRRVAAVHLKVDTGMGRLGVAAMEAAALLEELEKLPSLAVQGLYTHYAAAEEDAEFTAEQRRHFHDFVAHLCAKGRRFEWLHASNSAGLLLEPPDGCNLVRAGLLVFGIVPPGKRLCLALACRPFRPALTWKCRVGLVKEAPPGTPISYGHTFITAAKTRLAILTAGYGDGYLRSASNRAQVLIGGQRCAVLGRVTMDQMVTDISDVPGVQPGDEAVFIGRQGGDRITANELAGWCDTIPWEILTNITYRVPRLYRGGQAA